MAAKKKTTNNSENPEESNTASLRGIVAQDISAEMREAYIDYAMTVITSRALPDVRDGLKPVHRRILYAMSKLNLTPSGKTRKSATVVGEVIGKYHPHGDTAVYDSMVNLTQDFTMRYPLIIGQGNFGCFTKNTEVRLADGRNLSFGDLVKEHKAGKKNYTFTTNDDGKISIAEILNPRMTKRDAQLVQVTLDTGEKIVCTPDHRFLLKNQEYVEAENLVAGESLMPLYTRLSKKEDSDIKDMVGYEMIFNPLHNEWVYTHRLSDEFNLKRNTYKRSAGRVRHHSDFNKLNNSPDNIQRMGWVAHWRLHSSLTKEKHASDAQYREKLANGRRAFWDKKENRKAYSERMSQRNKRDWQDPIYRKNKRAFLSKMNKEYIKNHPEVRVEMSERFTKTLKRAWQDPKYRALMNEKIIRANKSRKYNKTGKVKFDAICKSIFESGKRLSENTYEKVRMEVYPYGSATKWNTGLTKYYSGETQKIRAEVVGNHKVSKVERITQREDVYDLTIEKTHNFALAAGVFVHNSIDGDNAAAMRYTEAKVSNVAMELLRDLGKNTVNYRANYDSTEQEPVVLPAAVPNLLLNGTLGIAVGMATNIPPHNFGEVVDAVMHLIDNPKSTTEDLLEFVKGPDFPTGCVAYNTKDIAHAYATGRGGVVVRGEAEVVEDKKGMFQIIITSIPYRVNKSNLITKIADLVRDKKLEGIKGLRDESTTDIRVAIDLKGTAHPQSVLNYIYKHTQLEETFHYNMVALVDGVPKTLALKAMLESYITHRIEVVTRRTQFDLDKAKAREHILLGLKKALDNIDKVIALIRKSNDVPTAHAGLMKAFKFSAIQATAILEMRLQKLANLERKKIDEELAELKTIIADLESLLKSKTKMMTLIKKELKEVTARLGDERRTKIMKHGTKNFSMEDVVPDDEYALVLTKGGYIKRTNPDEYRRQKRGGVGVIDMNTKEEDVVKNFLTTGAHSELLFFTDKGKVYRTKMYEIPEGKRSTKGKSIMNFLQLEQDENVTSILPMPKEAKERDGLSLLMVTREGTVKKTAASHFHEVRQSGLIAIKLNGKDRLIAAHFLNKNDDVVLVTRNGQAIRFKESDAREMGRTAAGVRGIKLQKEDEVIGAGVVPSESKGNALFVLSGTGYGKKTKMSEYKVQKRAGTGIKTSQITPKTKEIIGAEVIRREGGEIVAISKKGQVIRTSLDEVKLQGRQTQGVRIMKLRAGDSIASVITLNEDASGE